MGDNTTPTAHIFDNGAAAYEASTGGCTRDLARHMLSLAGPIPSGSTIHDNACGTGIVAQELVARDVLSQSPPDPNYKLNIHCTDKSEKMIQLAQSGFKDCDTATDMQSVFPGVKVDFATMPSEKLAFKDGFYTHSFTNCGILWFDDGLAGAREILRTTRPGGIAVISSWKEMPIFDVVREAQRACGHQEPLFRPPVDEKWFSAEYLESVLREAGFKDVHMNEVKVHFAGKDVSELCEHLLGLLRQMKLEWSGDEGRMFRQHLEAAAGKVAVSFERSSAVEVAEMIGISMLASIAVARI